ncbi:MAG: valine--tRNA ligase [Patescibacteria group bacterium]
MELEKAYQAKQYEDLIYKKWEQSGLFSPKAEKGKKPFTIMMPPPNATGTLHLGHAVMLALEDIMVRYHRMKGDAALWVPGTDHAGIATQNKVEKLIAEEGLTRQKLGREKFLERVEKFVAGSRSTIRNQIRKMGSSCDWTRERYTLDEQLSRAVREVFVRMYKDGLIYRGHRIVNWCPRCSSTLADDEVTYKEEKAKFYYFKYGPFVIGTARPETKFLDKVIVVHPDDKRYKKYIGKEMEVPWIEGTVKARVLADKSADPKFGTGAMTITPAHDFVDFELAQRHGLEIVQIIDEKGDLTSAAGEFAGQNARKAREGIVKKLEEKGLVEKIDDKYVHNVSLCYRCGTHVEPLVSDQWFIDVDKKFRAGKSLKDMALEVVKNGKVKIVPERFEKTYFHWMENLHDWCISRQIWFGHRIPVWYCEKCGEVMVSGESPIKCTKCGSNNLRQDNDTLDTWFSSGLWTFSTLGWPEKTADLDFFHPTSVLETGYDILFFWIARMILMTTYALDQVPFEKVYLHGLVRTREGKKMSKSDPKTCIDPLDMIDKYGADALRLSMVIGSTPGNDIRLYEEKIANYRNFVNKIWNAARYALMQKDASCGRVDCLASSPRLAGDPAEAGLRLSLAAKTLADKWILTRTQELIKEVTDDIENFRFSDAGTKIYNFTWDDYCAWYLEISKGEQQNLSVLSYVLKTILALLHPFVPFVTEAIWEQIGEKNMLIGEKFPTVDKSFIFTKDAKTMSVMVDAVTAIRNLRQESKIEPAKKIRAILASAKWKELLEEKREPIMRLARLSELEILEKSQKIHPSLTHYTNDGVEIILPLADLIDVKAETARLTEEKKDLEKYITSMEAKLENPNFAARAPREIVATEKDKLRIAKEKLEKINSQLGDFQG